MPARTDLVSATKELLWERGYESMSPGAIMQRSGVGQGSFYHHFRGKPDLAATALAEIGDEVDAINKKTLLDPGRSAFENVVAHVVATRPAVKGCRIGRYANETEVAENPQLSEPVRKNFDSQRKLIASALAQAQSDGDFDPEIDVDEVALCLIAVIQGGYNLSRLHGDPRYMERAVNGAVALLKTHRCDQHKGAT